MPDTKQLRSKKKHKKIQKYLGVTVFVLIVTLSPILIYSFISPSKFDTSEFAPTATGNAVTSPGANSDLNTQDPDITEVADASSEMGGKWLGLCKKNSIKSVEDFQRTIQNDEVLSSHYSGFDWKNARLGKQNEEILAFVSHRKGDVIKETSKPIKLPKGDGYITDGTHVARTFCCNDIILAPSAGPPPDKDILSPSAGPPYDIYNFPQSEDPLPDMYIMPQFYPLYGGIGQRKTYHTTNKDPDSEPIPEPGTLILFGIGLAVLATVYRRRNPVNKQ